MVLMADLIFAFFLIYFEVTFVDGQSACNLRSIRPQAYTRKGDIIIGGIFPVHNKCVYYSSSFTEPPQEMTCESFLINTYQQVQAMIFGINEINQNPKILPNTTLGFHIYDSCYSEGRAVEGSMWMLSGKKELVPNYRCQTKPQFSAVIGDEASASSVPIARVLGIYRYPQLLHYVRNVHFKTNEGDEMVFDANGDPPPVYDIINQQISADGTKKCVNVGYFDYRQPSGKQVNINDKAIKWNGAFSEVPHSVCSENCSPGYRKSARKGQPICCFDCVPCSDGEIANQTDVALCMKCPESQWASNKRDKCLPRLIEFLSYDHPLGIMFAAISTACSLLTASILCVFMKYRETPIVKANNRDLSYLLLLSLILCFLCSLVFIGKPTTMTCVLRQVLFSIVFSFCIACVLAKTITVVIAFNATKPESKLRKWVGPGIPIYIVVLSSLIQIIMGIVWLTTSPPFVVHNVKSLRDKIIIECDEGSIVMFYCMLGYLGLLAGISFIVAFLARKLPDSFNEAKYITFSMLAFASVWISFIPAYLSAKGMYLVAVEIFAILSSSIGLICCIFIPKCYIILLRPHMNTRGYLMGRGNVQARN